MRREPGNLADLFGQGCLARTSNAVDQYPPGIGQSVTSAILAIGSRSHHLILAQDAPTADPL
jgi:hypothetical protein